MEAIRRLFWYKIGIGTCVSISLLITIFGIGVPLITAIPLPNDMQNPRASYSLQEIVYFIIVLILICCSYALYLLFKREIREINRKEVKRIEN